MEEEPVLSRYQRMRELSRKIAKQEKEEKYRKIIFDASIEIFKATITQEYPFHANGIMLKAGEDTAKFSISMAEFILKQTQTLKP